MCIYNLFSLFFYIIIENNSLHPIPQHALGPRLCLGIKEIKLSNLAMLYFVFLRDLITFLPKKPKIERAKTVRHRNNGQRFCII